MTFIRHFFYDVVALGVRSDFAFIKPSGLSYQRQIVAFLVTAYNSRVRPYRFISDYMERIGKRFVFKNLNHITFFMRTPCPSAKSSRRSHRLIALCKFVYVCLNAVRHVLIDAFSAAASIRQSRSEQQYKCLFRVFHHAVNIQFVFYKDSDLQLKCACLKCKYR